MNVVVVLNNFIWAKKIVRNINARSTKKRLLYSHNDIIIIKLTRNTQLAVEELEHLDHVMIGDQFYKLLH